MPNYISRGDWFLLKDSEITTLTSVFQNSILVSGPTPAAIQTIISTSITDGRKPKKD